MAELPDPGVIESLLEALANRPDGGIVAQLPREIGRRDSRWAQLFEELPEVVASERGRCASRRTSGPAPRQRPGRARRGARKRSGGAARGTRRTTQRRRHEHSRVGAKRRVARRLQRVHDVRVVRAPQELAAKPWVIAALASWGIALFEYLLQVPANRIGYTQMSLGQLKVMQEVITLAVFVPFAILLHEAAAEAGLPVGRTVPGRRRRTFAGSGGKLVARLSERSLARAQRVDILARAYPRSRRNAPRRIRPDPRDRSRTPSTAPRCVRRRAS